MEVLVSLVKVLAALSLAAIALLIYSSAIANEKLKLVSIFMLGICQMVLSFLGGFSIGKFTILIAICLWFYLLTNYKNLKIRVVIIVLLVITLAEAIYLM